MKVSRWWHNFHFLVCIIKCLMCIIDRLLQYTIIFYFSLSFRLSLSSSTHSGSFVCDFSHSAQHQWAHLLYRNLSIPLPLLFLFKEIENHLVLTLFAKTTFKRCCYLIYTQSMSTRRDLQEQFVVLTDLIFHALVTLLCVVNCCPLVAINQHYATKDKNSLSFSSLGRINITSRYVTCCYGDGPTVLFTEKRRWFGGQRRKGMRSRWHCTLSGGLLP